MQTTQLTCPHCASMLNFGAAISAGTPVECLICMRAFTAVNPVTVEAVAPPPRPIATSRVSATANAEKAKPHCTPDGVVASKSVPIGLPAPPLAELVPAPRPSIRLPADGPNIALIAGVVAVLLLLTGGIVVGLWKVAAPMPNPSGGKEVAQIEKANDPENGGGNPLNNSAEDDEDIRANFQEEIKQVLKRKPRTKVDGTDSQWNLDSTVLAKNAVAGLDQDRIDLAIKRGVAHLKESQQPNGTWNIAHSAGHAALGGLTLLECDVRADDPAVQRAAAFVRSQSAGLRTTYELALSVLFLDRLGEARDRPLIQGMALRLMSGQNEAGGWTYVCDALSPQDMVQLFTFLKANEQLLNPVGIMPKGYALNSVRDPDLALNDPFRQFHELMLTQGVESGKATDDPKGSAKVPVSQQIPPLPIRAEGLNPNVKHLPVVQQKTKGKGRGKTSVRRGGGDNSNTQFAMLALWSARRHGVPTTQALLLANQRFTISQNGDNGWGYLMQAGSTNTMTCVGLLGLGIGHGAAAPEVVNAAPNNPKSALEDARIQNGLKALARNIGQPSADAKKDHFPVENLYFLWSVERVAMLYDLKTIGGKDWYGWGAQILVHNQNADGAWHESRYPGANVTLNTCFALLFLKRSNLVADLTDNLRLNVGIREP